MSVDVHDVDLMHGRVGPAGILERAREKELS